MTIRRPLRPASAAQSGDPHSGFVRAPGRAGIRFVACP